MNTLNEHLFSKAYETVEDVEVTTAVDPTYADAVKTRGKTKKALDDKFKEQDKASEDFVKQNQKTENKPKGTKEMKKMKLSESLFEASDLTSSNDLFYRTTRESVADVIMMTLTSGEPAYKRSAGGKLVPTTAPSLNIDESDIGADEDRNGYYIVANVADAEMQKRVEGVAKRFGKQFVSTEKTHTEGGKNFCTKIYIDESDWDTPCVEKGVQTRLDARKSA